MVIIKIIYGYAIVYYKIHKITGQFSASFKTDLQTTRYIMNLFFYLTYRSTR